MVQCEMCGAETPSPNTVKIEGAELDVCDDCADFGTEVRTDDSSSTSTKYSTSGSGSDSQSSQSSGRGGGAGSGSGSGSGGSERRRDMFDEMDEVAQDYDERIRSAREAAGLSQEEMASQLNEKASLIRKLERREVLPSDDIQRTLERAFDIDLTAGGSGPEDTEWEGGSTEGEYTLGDVVRRKDS